MFKPLVALMIPFLLPTFAGAKPSNVYPVSCSVLWVSVKDTLVNQRNYSLMAIDDLNRRASFVVVGNLTQFTDRVALEPRDGSCELNSSFLEVGADNSDFRQFHHRLAQSLAKLQAARARLPETSAAQP